MLCNDLKDKEIFQFKTKSVIRAQNNNKIFGIAFGNTVPNFSPNDRKRVFMMIKPRIVNMVEEDADRVLYWCMSCVEIKRLQIFLGAQLVVISSIKIIEKLIVRFIAL